MRVASKDLNSDLDLKFLTSNFLCLASYYEGLSHFHTWLLHYSQYSHTYLTSQNFLLSKD